MYPAAKTWQGMPSEEMAEVHSRIGPSIAKSPVAPPKEKREKTESSRQRGVVKLFFTEKKFGFVNVKGAEDLFFHASDADGYPMKGDRVTFEIGTDRNGRACAKDVQLA